MLTGKQKRYLRSLAHNIDPTFQIGKGGQQISETLEKRELIKIHILQNNFDDKKDLAAIVSQQTQSELVQIIGSMIVLYKESEENKEIKLPQ
ncbi:MAG: ribosome assembly RNA-binding protein YhbY [Staphylococcus epidermidis]|nr:ribosome assembly RNA-binding protein YhbY [Staphylococcus epidermidis]